MICFTESSDGINISPRSFYFVRKWIAPAHQLAHDCSAGQGGPRAECLKVTSLSDPLRASHLRKRRMRGLPPDASDGQEQMNEKEACA
ncbi:hypothetical protein [Paenibacillus thiaminolyticus]|uniref:Uncharacterized protein n=1 Tax=Paenibacillus thiaminolyticus TaxID=49283 RepID=A0A3A3GI66_PANTH|nr:hypothetical protein [Paenibacillus thiaminolyticus]RJG21895.1 hypothetical protein DQX05_19975 [Paenibacillus thiaminolyticus]